MSPRIGPIELLIIGAVCLVTLIILGALVFLVLRARPGSTMPREDTKKCPFCAETIKKEAVVCRYCGRDLPPIT